MGKVIHIDGNGGGGGTGTGWDGQVEFRANLPITLVAPPIGSIYLVEKPTKVLGITVYQSGLYMKDADTGSLSDWRRLNIAVTLYNSDGTLAGNRILSGDTTRYSLVFKELSSFFAQSKGAGAGGEESSILLNQNLFDIDFGGQGFTEGSAFRFKGDPNAPKIEIHTQVGGAGFQISKIVFPDASGGWTWNIQDRSGTFAFQDEILKQKAGEVLNAGFSGNPKKTAPIVFATAYPDNLYSVQATAITQNNTSYVITVEAKTSTGFTINANSNNINDLIAVSWTCTKHGEAV